MLMKLKFKKIFLIFLLNLFTASLFAESNLSTIRNNEIKKDIQLRGKGTKISKQSIIKKLTKKNEVFDFNKEKNLRDKDYLNTLAASLSVPGSLAKSRILTRGSVGNNIYKNYVNSVVYIGNPEGESVGAGFLIDQPGIILTNWHVTKKATDVLVWLLPNDDIPSEETLFTKLTPLFGTVMAENKKEDLAIVKVGNFPNNITPVKVGNNNNIGIGDKVYAIGHPGGFPWTFSEGTINQIRKNFKWSYNKDDEHEATLIQIQTPINPGNSGGPLFSDKGELIGVNTLKGGGENLNFAVAVDHAINFLKKNSYIKTTNPAEIIMKKDYPKAKTQDYNKNGVIDTWYLDTNNNDKIDQAFVDDNEDGFIEAILIDENENGIWELQLMDDDLDGNANRAIFDENEDKKIDVIAYDDNQDGEWDRFKEIS